MIMRRLLVSLWFGSLLVLSGCGDGDSNETSSPGTSDAGQDSEPDTQMPEADVPDADVAPEGGEDAGDEDAGDGDAEGPDAQDDGGCGSAIECAAIVAEQAAFDKLVSVAGDEDALRDFLTRMPKGGDLHSHLSGAVYAETYLDWAKTGGGYCITLNNLSLSTSCAPGTPVPSPGEPLFQQLVGAWSMEGFVPSAAESGHDHFFATFGKFGAISGTHHGAMLADVMARAASENEVYLEPMLTSNSTAQNLGSTLWGANHPGVWLSSTYFAGFRDELMAAPTWSNAVQRLLTDVQQSEAKARQILGCDTAQPADGCSVGVRYAAYISRGGHTAGVFAQMVAAFEAAKQEPRLVALNLVGPEDSTTALNRYDDAMSMLAYLHDTYTATGASPLRITLHAGELAPKYMPSGYDIATEDHVRKAVQVARAERIGHGVDVLLQADSTGLLEELKQKRILVEICLSSNVQILEISGAAHPLATFLDHGVPVALATDDQGVSRSSMTGEHMRAVQDQQLDYRVLKAMARNSLEYSFLPGESLWENLDDITPVADCANTATTYLGEELPPASCESFLSSNARAAHQWELERRFRAFEANP
jgi:adenosine deaminase